MSRLRKRKLSSTSICYFISIILIQFLHNNISADELSSYKDEHVTFEYPVKFKVTTNLVKEDYKEISIIGPKGSFIIILAMPEAIPVELNEFKEVIHNKLVR